MVGLSIVEGPGQQGAGVVLVQLSSHHHFLVVAGSAKILGTLQEVVAHVVPLVYQVHLLKSLAPAKLGSIGFCQTVCGNGGSVEYRCEKSELLI